MALNINGRMKVKTLRADFKKEFGLALRVYDGRSFADDNATLASIRKGDSVGGEFSPQRNTKVGNLEDKIMDMFGIKTQVAGSDDSYLCDNEKTLAGALEADEKLMVKREKRGDSTDAPTQKDEGAYESSDSGEWTEEEKKWLDDLWSLDEAPESIRSSKKFMLEAVKLDGQALEEASEELQNDREMVLIAVSDNGKALEFASDKMKKDREVILTAVQNYGNALEYSSEEFKNDKEMVLVAVSNMGNALEFADERIQDDEDIVHVAINNDGSSLEYVSDRLKQELKSKRKKYDSGQYIYMSFGKKDEDESFPWSTKAASIMMLTDEYKEKTYYWFGEKKMQYNDDNYYEVVEIFAKYFIDEKFDLFDDEVTKDFIRTYMECALEGDDTEMKDFHSKELIFLDEEEAETDEYDGRIFLELHIVDDIDFETDDSGLYIDDEFVDNPMDNFDHYDGRIFVVL